ncbi:MAG: hypothetical protein F4X22_14750 [Gemmatimonadales bacterium]|nr:hypothetical protein [Candidatus Palauibacter denitrificans]
MLDLAKVRNAYFDPPPGDPERALTREELYARYERRRVEGCLRRGGNPRREGLGEHGSLIGGTEKPLTAFGVRPERAGRLQPLPLAWFDYPRARFAHPPPGGTEEAHDFFAALAADHLAGMPERPSGSRLAHTFCSAQLKGREWSQVWHVFACIRTWDLKRLLSRGGLSLYEVARAIHRSDTCRAEVVTWINQFAVPPSQQEDAGPPQDDVALSVGHEAFHPTHTPREPEIVDSGQSQSS